MAIKFYYVDQMKKYLEDLKELRYRDSFEIDTFEAIEEAKSEQVNVSPLNGKSKEGFILKKGDFWHGRDSYIWLSANVSVRNHHKVVGFFDFGTTGGGNNSGFEALLYVNGKMYTGVDSNHKEVIFDTGELGCQLRLDFRLWSGLEGGGQPRQMYHQIKTAKIGYLDEATDDLYYTGYNLIQAMESMDESDYNKSLLKNILLETMKRIDFTDKGKEGFYKSVDLANSYLQEELKKHRRPSNLTVSCIGHTHIDLAWLWRIKHTREKAARSFSTVSRLMKLYPEYIFLQTTAQLYEYIKNDFPDLYEEIKDLVKKGNWEPAGGMWVEADCNIPSGESLVRQILYGKRYFKKDFGYESKYLWLPDVFGYSWALPQILKKSGIDTFMTTKISWNEYNRLPADTFIWRGLDGSEILTHFITTPTGDDAWFYTYNGEVEAFSVKGIWDTYINKDLNQDLLLSYGYGDGGGGVNRDMLENRRRLDGIPGMPNVKTRTATEYFEQLHERVFDKDNHGYLHTWDRELYFEFHRGTYTSQAYNKFMNRKLEILYREAEILASHNAINKKTWSSYDKAALDLGWKIILRNQFHDIIPGSSIGEVYEDSRLEYEEAYKLGENIINSSVDSLLEVKTGDYNNLKDKELLVYNSYGHRRTSIIRLAKPKQEGYYVDENNNPIESQLGQDHMYLKITDIDPFSFKGLSYKFGKNSEKKDEKLIQIKAKKSISTNLYDISWNEDGQLTSIYSKKYARQIITDRANVFELFEDKPRMFDAWELEQHIDLKKEEVTDFLGAKIIENGSQLAKILFEWQYRSSRIRQELVLYRDKDRIDFSTLVDWQERDRLLKVKFPVDVRSTSARFDTQFGSLERPTHRSNSWDFAMFEVVGHMWCDLAERGFGIGLLNDCKYGYDVLDNIIRLSLLKGASYPDPNADKGKHSFTYSLYPHTKEWYDSELLAEAWDLNSPLLVRPGPLGLDLDKGLLNVEGDYYHIDAIKKSEDGESLIIRLHETSGGKSRVSLRPNFDYKECYQVNLMEERLKELAMADQEIKLELKPFEIITLAFDL